MLHFKLKPNAISPQSTTPMEDYLHSIGIEQIEEFMNHPSPSSELCGALLTNGAKMVYKLKGAERAKTNMVIDLM